MQCNQNENYAHTNTIKKEDATELDVPSSETGQHLHATAISTVTESVNPLFERKYMNIAEAANYCNYKKSYMYKLTCLNLVPHYKRGKIIFIKEELDKWLLGNRVKTKEEINQEAQNYINQKDLFYGK